MSWWGKRTFEDHKTISLLLSFLVLNKVSAVPHVPETRDVKPSSKDTVPPKLEEQCGRRQKTVVSGRIINGTEAADDDWPWMAGVYNSTGSFICGGVLIGPQYVLTAAHCVEDYEATYLLVGLGSNNKLHPFNEDYNQSGAERHDNTSEAVSTRNRIAEEQTTGQPQPAPTLEDIEEVCVPVQENNCSLFMRDLAVLKLKKNATLAHNIEPICLPEDCAEIPENVSFYITGWGETETNESGNSFEISLSSESSEDNQDNANEHTEPDSLLKEPEGEVSAEDFKLEFENLGLPDKLLQRIVTYMPQRDCEERFPTVPGYAVCSPSGVCYGDSGGPVVYEKRGKWTLDAIISTGSENCIHPEKPSTYVRVSNFVSSFLDRYIKDGNPSVCATKEVRNKCINEFLASYEAEQGQGAASHTTRQ